MYKGEVYSGKRMALIPQYGVKRDSMDKMETNYDVEKVDLDRHDVLYVPDVAPVATGKQLDEKQNRNVGDGSFHQCKALMHCLPSSMMLLQSSSPSLLNAQMLTN